MWICSFLSAKGMTTNHLSSPGVCVCVHVHACASSSSICVCVYTCARSVIWLFVTPWTVAHQAPLSMGFSRQEYLSGLPFPPPGDLPDPGIKPVSPALVDRFFFLTTQPLGKPNPGMTIQLTSFFFFNSQNSEEYFRIFFMTQIFVATIAGGSIHFLKSNSLETHI